MQYVGPNFCKMQNLKWLQELLFTMSVCNSDVSHTPSKSMISDDEDEGVSGEVESMTVPKPKDAKEGQESDSDDDDRDVSQ